MQQIRPFKIAAILAIVLGLSAGLSEGANAENILVIGDSHTCGYYGDALVSKLVEAGNDVQVYCTVASAARHWVQGQNPKGFVCMSWHNRESRRPCGAAGEIIAIDKLLKNKTFDAAIVSLGTNSLGATPDSAHAEMAKIVKAHVKRCLWVGPPHLRADEVKGFSPAVISQKESTLDEFQKALSGQVSKSCEFFDSREVSKSGGEAAPTVDGIHRTKTAGVAWANVVFEAFRKLTTKLTTNSTNKRSTIEKPSNEKPSSNQTNQNFQSSEQK